MSGEKVEERMTDDIPQRRYTPGKKRRYVPYQKDDIPQSLCYILNEDDIPHCVKGLR